MAQGWRVTSQRQTTELTPDGRFQDVMEISFQLDSGTVGLVRVPLIAYNPDRVKELIDQQAQTLTAVENL